jgi:hypothetical protein
MKKIIIVLLTLFFVGCKVYDYKDTNQYFDIVNTKMKKYNIKNRDYVVVIDYRKHLFSNRLYLLDIKNKKVILNCKVTHARKSGLLYANDFSNRPKSEKSSAGAFITKHSRPGRYGYSMVISGLDVGKNNNVENRVIIFHPTRVPWSKGCFATSRSNNKIIIDHMKNGRFIYVISNSI